jgi:hypothetical protein
MSVVEETMNNIKSIIDKYETVKDKRISRLVDFEKGARPFLVCTDFPNSFVSNCNSIERSFNANLADFAAALDIPSDTLPYLEPWFGTGVYANAFGCKYFWREGESPACHYAYRSIEQIRGIQKPDISQGRMFAMVMDAIDYFKEKTAGQLPICVTDTQSASDTASLILDASEFFTCCYAEPETARHFLKIINEMIIDFTKMQADAIGDCLALPGHNQRFSYSLGRGMSLSDDNLAVSSPKINSEFFLPLDDQIGAAFGGVAIHSCGNWGHTMPLVAKMKNLYMIDCTISYQCDPNPCMPEQVRDAFKDTDIIVQVRIGKDLDVDMPLLKRLLSPDLRLVISIAYEPDKIQDRYDQVIHFLGDKLCCVDN